MHPASKNYVCVSMIKDGLKNHWEQACNLPKYLMSFVKNPDFDSCDIYIARRIFQQRRQARKQLSVNPSMLCRFRLQAPEEVSPRNNGEADSRRVGRTDKEALQYQDQILNIGSTRIDYCLCSSRR